MNRDYTTIGNWCIDAQSVTAPELPEKIAEMRFEVIRRHVGKPTIIQIAQELADGLNDLPTSQRLAAQDALHRKYGFGFDYFIKNAQLRIAKIVARGKIRNEKEHRAIVDALSDTTLDSSFALHLERLLFKYENPPGAA